MNCFKKLFALLIISLCFSFPAVSAARDSITDWYIKSLNTGIVVNRDSSLDITENIQADCGNLPNKHGRSLARSIYVRGRRWILISTTR